MTAADTVIIFDSDWNPQNDIQAQARCHRIGQKSEVKVYRLITANTYERRMFERSSKKLGLDQAVLHDMGSNAELMHQASTTSTPGEQCKLKSELLILFSLQDLKRANTLDKKEIDDLLKFGAYDLFNDKDNEKEKQFYEEDIDQILNRSSKVVWNETSAKVLGAGSSFSKASFRSSTAEPNIDINDPNFWNKVLPGNQYSINILTNCILQRRKLQISCCSDSTNQIHLTSKKIAKSSFEICVN